MRLTSSRRKPFRSMNADFRAAVAAHARFMTRPMRSTAKAGVEANEKAIEYARWLMERDGCNVDALADAVREAHNAKHPPIQRKERGREWEEANPEAIYANAKLFERVQNDPCTFGLRPHIVHFEFRVSGRGEGMRNVRHLSAPISVYSLELPNWAARVDFDIEGEEDVAQEAALPFEPLALAA